MPTVLVHVDSREFRLMSLVPAAFPLLLPLSPHPASAVIHCRLTPNAVPTPLPLSPHPCRCPNTPASPPPHPSPWPLCPSSAPSPQSLAALPIFCPLTPVPGSSAAHCPLRCQCRHVSSVARVLCKGILDDLQQGMFGVVASSGSSEKSGWPPDWSLPKGFACPSNRVSLSHAFGASVFINHVQGHETFV
eukprot:356075-Chlamydomonas_euryale.AAC.2